MSVSAPGWSMESNRLQRDYVFRNFLEAMAFLNHVAEIAEAANHHPDLHLTKYKFVRVELWTHTTGGVTERDFELANKIGALGMG